MIWALLAILGVPVWLIVGALGATLWSRHRFRAQDGVFPLAIRLPGKTKWPRVPAFGRVISDVIVVNRGPALQRTAIHQIRAVHDLALAEAPSPKGLEDAVGRLLDLDDGTAIEVALPAGDADQVDQLRGPDAPGPSQQDAVHPEADRGHGPRGSAGRE